MKESTHFSGLVVQLYNRSFYFILILKIRRRISRIVELKVVYETYPEDELVKSTFSGETEKDAFLEMLETVYMYLSSEEAEELTVEEIIEELQCQNGTVVISSIQLKI